VVPVLDTAELWLLLRRIVLIVLPVLLSVRLRSLRGLAIVLPCSAAMERNFFSRGLPMWYILLIFSLVVGTWEIDWSSLTDREGGSWRGGWW
jgi:uncharacterized membrane protein YhaH (DUF805 family)